MKQIAIRDIQHFLYCPHRWGLLKIDCAWAENYFVTKANLLHKRVHESEIHYFSRDKKAITTLNVYNDSEAYGIYGVLDCLELSISESGVKIDSSGKKYKLSIVEYKPTAPNDCEFNLADAVQVFAQKICVDNIFATNCQGIIYYSNIKKRVVLPFEEQYEFYDSLLKKTLVNMRKFLEKEEIPPISKDQYCKACSFKDLCMPSKKKYNSVKSVIKELMD